MHIHSGHSKQYFKSVIGIDCIIPHNHSSFFDIIKKYINYSLKVYFVALWAKLERSGNRLKYLHLLGISWGYLQKRFFLWFSVQVHHLWTYLITYNKFDYIWMTWIANDINNCSIQEYIERFALNNDLFYLKDKTMKSNFIV